MTNTTMHHNGVSPTTPGRLTTGSGAPLSVIAPTRFHAYRADERRYSLSATADFLADAGFDGADLSFDALEPPRDFDNDEGFRAVLWSFANRAAARGLSLPLCHLPFYMPDPDNTVAMARFARLLQDALRAAAGIGIHTAVVHPIVRHSSARSRDAWLAENLSLLRPLREEGARLGVTLCVENMVGRPYAAHPDETVFGSRAEDVRALAEALGTAVCWDFGHANLTGLCQSVELERLAGLVRVVHIHDNDGVRDTHRIPGSLPSPGAIDWADAAEGLRLCGYLTTPGRCFELELKTSDLPDDLPLRHAYAARALAAAAELAERL